MRNMIQKLLLIFTIILGWINLPAQAFILSANQDLWPVLSQNFSILSDADKGDIQYQIDRDLQHPRYIQKLTKNARPYLYYIYQETQKKHLPAELALLPMIESEYTPSGYSSKGAVGLWQLMPHTAYLYGVKINTWYDGRRSTTVSTTVALKFLSYLYDQFHHNWLLALAAYNAGPGTVSAAIHYNRAHGQPTNFWALHLPAQTEAYIPKLLALAAIIQHPAEYGIHLIPVPNKPITSTVTIKKQMPLQTIAHLAHTSVHTVKKLNPALKKTETPPHQIVTLVLPANKKTEFENHLKSQTATQKALAEKKLDQYTVQHGDSLSSIASKYKITIDALKEMNQLHSEIIRSNQLLIVPKLFSHVERKATATALKPLRCNGSTRDSKCVKLLAQKTSVKPQRLGNDTRTSSIDSHGKEIRHVRDKAVTHAAHPTTTPAISHDHEHTYIVKRGDNLHRLAAEFNTTTYHILAHNHLKTATLQVGQRLLMPNA